MGLHGDRAQIGGVRPQLAGGFLQGRDRPRDLGLEAVDRRGDGVRARDRAGVLVVAFGDKERGSSLLVPPRPGQIGARRILSEARYRWGHGSPRVIRRWILSILLFSLIATVAGWQEAVPQTRAVDGAVTLPRPLAAAIDAVVRALHVIF